MPRLIRGWRQQTAAVGAWERARRRRERAHRDVWPNEAVRGIETPAEGCGGAQRRKPARSHGRTRRSAWARHDGLWAIYGASGNHSRCGPAGVRRRGGIRYAVLRSMNRPSISFRATSLRGLRDRRLKARRWARASSSPMPVAPWRVSFARVVIRRSSTSVSSS